MAGMNPADYQGYIKSLNIKLPNTPPSTGAQPPASPTGVSASAGLTPGYMQQKPAAYSPQSASNPGMATNYQNATNAPSAPSTGFGGANYNTADTATQQGISANEARLASDPNFVKSEYARAQGVINTLKSSGSDYTAQQNYFNRLQGMMPQAAPVQQTAGVTPAQAPTAAPPAPSAPNTISTDAIKAEVEARLAQQRAGIKGAVDYTKTNLKNTYDYTRGLQNDQRVLEDGKFNDTNNPFSGATGYRASMMDRNRSIADTAQNKDYAANVSAADQRLADFDALAPDQKNALYDQLLRTERDYGLNVGQLTGNFNGDRTLAGSAQDANFTGTYNGQQTMQAQNQAFNQGIAEGQLTGQYNGQSTLAGKQANWNAYQDAVGMTGNLGSGPKDNWSQLPGQTGAPSYQAQQQNTQNTAQYTGYYNGMPTMQKMMQDNTIKNMNDDNVRAAATEARTAGNQALATKFDIWDRTGQAPDGIPGVAKGTVLPGKTPTGLKESDIADLIDKSPYIQKQYDSDGKVIGTAVDPAQKQALSQYIASLGLPREQAKQWFIRYGLWSPSGN